MSQHTHLSTPTHAQAAPLLDPTRLLLNLLHQLRHLLRRLLRICRSSKEIAQLLLFFIRVGWKYALGQGFAEEEVGYEDLVLVGAVGMGEDIGALDGLRAEAEDVVDDEDCTGGIGGAGCV